MSYPSLPPPDADLSKLVGLDVMLCFGIYSTEHAITRFYRPMLDALGLTYPQFVTMMALWEQPRSTLKSIGERLGLDSGTLTPLIKKLEARGLVTRARNPGDERLLDVTLTDAGLAMRDRGKAAAMAVFTASGETPETLLELLGRLARIRDGVGAATR